MQRTVSGGTRSVSAQHIRFDAANLFKPIKAFIALGLLLLAVGCTQTKGFTAATAETTAVSAERVLLMPPDVEISLLTTAGLEEPNAEWTQAGRRNIRQALQTQLSQRAIDLVQYDAGDGGDRDDIAPEHVQLVKLHGAISRSVKLHKYVSGFELPTTENQFDWTLGQGAKALKEDYDADHALFVFARDSFSSGGRMALIFTAALLFGVGIEGGSQIAVVSLVDLDSGQVVWFNTLASEIGDFRKPDQASAAIETLLEDAPFGGVQAGS